MTYLFAELPRVKIFGQPQGKGPLHRSRSETQRLGNECLGKDSRLRHAFKFVYGEKFLRNDLCGHGFIIRSNRFRREIADKVVFWEI